MVRLEKKHALVTRISHWLNAPILAVMVDSGLLIYWANDVYAIRLGNFTLFKFFPDWFFNSLHLGHRLAEGMAWHFTFMWLFAINGIVYAAYTAASGESSFPTGTRPATHGRWYCTIWAFAKNRGHVTNSTQRSASLTRGWS